MPPLVSICLTCKDRWELTKQALESIGGTEPHDLQFAMSIVDDCSTDETLANFEQYCKPIGWYTDNPDERLSIHLSDKQLGVGGSKNLAVENARRFGSKYLCLLDNDVVCKPGWLETMIESYEVGKQYGYKLIGGYTHPFNQTNKIHEAFSSSGITKCGRVVTLHEKNAVDGLCHFMEWETWDRFGPYDSHAQGVRQSEDFAFCRKIVDAGFKVGVVYPHVIENHGVVDTFGQKIPGWELVEKELQK